MIEGAPDPEVVKAAEAALADGAPSSGAPSPEPKKRGRPKGSKTRTTKAEPETKKADDGRPSPEELVAVTWLTSTVWQLLGPRVGLDPLTETEQTKLGEATACVLKKYAPAYGAWEVEINFVLVVGGLALTKYKGRAKAKDAGPEQEEVPFELGFDSPSTVATPDEIARRFGG